MFLTKFWRWLTGKAKKSAEAAVKIVDVLKGYVDSGFAGTIVNIIPGNLDNEILQKLRTIMPVIAVELSEANELLKKSGSPQEVIAAYVKYLQKVAPSVRAADYQELAGKLTQYLEDGHISFEEAVDLSQETYRVLKAKGVIK